MSILDSLLRRRAGQLGGQGMMGVMPINLGMGALSTPQIDPNQAIAMNDAQQIQQAPQQSLFGQYADTRMNQMGNQWQNQKDMWNNSSGLLDYAKQHMAQRIKSGNIGGSPQMPQMQATNLNDLMKMSRGY